MGPWGNVPTGYPTLPNPYGIGAQIDSNGGGGSGLAMTPNTQAGQGAPPIGGPAGAQQNSPPGYMTNPLTQPPTQNGSNGYSPWSLTGEANSR